MSDFFGVVNFDDPPDRPFIMGDVRDADLVLRAYERWGEHCVDHLHGDFAFAIWNGHDLFCARDHFGTKPFYYARRGDTFVFSNAIATLRKHSIVTDAIDDSAITDFLLFGWQQDRESTAFRDIRCLPAAHTLHARAMTRREYWTLPIEEPMRGDPVEGFRDVLAQAVRDRTPEKVTVSLSGGIDSSTITALAREVTSDIDAYTIAFDSLIPDDERPFATSVANHLDIRLHVIDGGAYRVFDPRITKEQPRNDPLDAISFDMHTAASQRANVMLAGQGGDAVMYASHAYFFNLLRRGRFIRFASDIAASRHRPFGLRSSVRRALGMKKKMERPPPWVKARDVADRWERYFGDEEEIHPTRPQAYNLLRGAGWQRLSEYLDPAAMGAPVEYRNPYLDVRVVRYVLRVPPMPWFAEKELLRASMRGRLPENVRLRRKTALRVDPTHVLMTRQADELAAIVQSCEALERFVDRTQAAAAIRNPRRTPFQSYLLAFPIGLALWPILKKR